MIKNLLFDLGGVIMDIDKNHCVDSFTKLGLPDANSYFGDYTQQGPFMLLESGAISVSDFHQLIRNAIPHQVTDNEIDKAFCDFLIGIPKYRLDMLAELRRRYKVYMLSNTNKIMWDTKIAHEFAQEGKKREDYFDGIVTSFEAKSMKPDTKIFEYAVEKLGIKTEETLFIDDSSKNLAAAAQLGFNTLLIRTGEEFADNLTKYFER